MKKSPEGSSFLVAFIAQHVNANLSTFASQGATAAATKLLRSPQSAVRLSGLIILRNLTKKVSDWDGYEAIVRGLQEALQAKAGAGSVPLTQAYQRAAVYAALCECARSLGMHLSTDTTASDNLFDSLLPALQLCMEKESDENGKLLGASCIGLFLRAGAVLPEPFLAAAAAALGAAPGGKASAAKAATTSTGYLIALIVALQGESVVMGPGPVSVGASEGVTKAVDGIASKLQAMVRDGIKAPTGLHVDAVLALRLLVLVSAQNKTAFTIVTQNNCKMLLNCLSAGSFLCSKLLHSNMNDASVYKLAEGRAHIVDVMAAGPTAEALVHVASTASKGDVLAYSGQRVLKAQLALAGSTAMELVCTHAPAPLAALLVDDAAAYSADASATTLEGQTPLGPVACLLHAAMHADKCVRLVVCSHIKMIVDKYAAYKDAKSGSKTPLPALLLRSLVGFIGALAEKDEREKLRLRMEYKTVWGTEELGEKPVPKSSVVFPSDGVLKAVGLACVPPFGTAPEEGYPVNVRARVLALGLLLAAHPCVTRSLKTVTSMWLEMMLVGSDSGVNGSSLHDAIETWDADFRAAFQTEIARQINAHALSDNAHMRYAIVQAVGVLCTQGGVWCTEVVSECLSPILVNALSNPELAVISPDDALKYNDPAAARTKALNAVSTNISEDDIKITNADRKKEGGKNARRGQFGGDLGEDEDWAERVKQEKLKKLGENRERGQAEALVTIDREIAEVRARVGAVLGSAQYALQDIVELVRRFAAKHVAKSSTSPAASTGAAGGAGLIDLLRKMVPSLMPVFVSLLQSPLLTDEAFECVRAVATLVEGPIAPLSTDLAASIRLAALMEKDVASALAAPGPKAVYAHTAGEETPLQRLIKGLAGNSLLTQARRLAQQHQSTQSPPLLPATVHMVFPVLKALLTAQTPVHGCDLTLFVLDSLWPHTAREYSAKVAATHDSSSPSSLGSIRSLLTTLLHTLLCVIANHPRMEPQPALVFERVFLGAGILSEEEWAPIVAETGLLSTEPLVRATALKCILLAANAAQAQGDAVATVIAAHPLMESRLWMLRFDEDDSVRPIADQIWHLWESSARETFLTTSSSKLPDYYTSLAPLLPNKQRRVRNCAAKAIAVAIGTNPTATATGATVDEVKSLFMASVPSQPLNASRPTPAKAAAPLANKALLASSAVSKPKPASKGVGGIGSISAISATAAPKTTKVVRRVVVKKVSASEADSKPKADPTASKPATVIAPRKTEIVEDKTFPVREAIAVFVEALSKQASLTQQPGTVSTLLDFVLSHGVVDLHAGVRDCMLTAGRALVDGFAVESTQCSQMFTAIQAVIAKKPEGDDPASLTAYDNRHEAAVVLLGAVGKHLDKTDPAVVSITDTLVQALNVPSESVQRAVADCLAPLIAVLKTTDHVKALLESLIEKALEAESYGERRGAAFGISACVKGMGIPSIKQHDLVTRLRDACSTGSVNARQGALNAFELLSARLGLVFEPYVISVVPVLLKCFSNSSDHVREAAQEATKVVMGKLSAHGVKQMLNPILASLPEETQWKSRHEAIRLLGMMAHCAPKQLSACLPQIIPQLVESGSDPHPKVKESAKEAMGDISSVIRNPELASLSPVLLAAIGDPANKTKEALEALLECEFMHAIDTPSLALLVPILSRALRERSADLKRKGSAITGNIMNMVGDLKALLPYLSGFLPGLKGCLVDPIPDVRATSAKALGKLVGGVGENEGEMATVFPWLMKTLTTESSPVERSGAAQGLAEICLAVGGDKVEVVLAETLPLQHSRNGAAREGLLWLLSFLPSSLNERFGPHIASTLPVVLVGLSDEAEGVREVALRAGQVLVATMGRDYTNEVLPSLTDGMFHEDYRIRLNSITLLGELLYLVGETKAFGGDADEEEAEFGGTGGSSRASQTIRNHVGEQTANEVFASLYIVRNDVTNTVRQTALQVWKSVITNTPRMLVEIMGELVRQVIEKLSSEAADMRLVAGRALGDVVMKLGDRVLPVVMPYLEDGLSSEDTAMRQGVCLGLSEILTAASKRQIETYLSIIVKAMRKALCDEIEDVRKVAGKAFATLYKSIGSPALDEIVPALLKAMAESGEVDSGDGQATATAMLGLREVVMSRPRDILEYLLPKLLTHPVQESSARALGTVASACGGQIHYHCSTLVPLFVVELYSTEASIQKLGKEAENEARLAAEQARIAAIKDAAAAVMGSMGTAGVNSLCSELGRQIEHETDPRRRRWGAFMAEQFFRHSKADFLDYVPVLLRYLLGRMAETLPDVLSAVNQAMAALVGAVPLDDLCKHLDFIRNCISSTCSDARHKVGTQGLFNEAGDFILPLFSLPKALDPLLQVFLHGLMNGSLVVRENASDGIGDLVAVTDGAALKPYLIKTTGPLIRVVGDRFPSSLKASILQTLYVLLDKGGAAIKAFVPQLQTTFVKNLADPSKQVRQRAIAALGKIMGLSVRVDPLLSELCVAISGGAGGAAAGAAGGAGTGTSMMAESSAIKASLLEALGTSLLLGGGKATAAGLEKVKAVVLSCSTDEDEAVRTACGKCALGIGACLEASQITDLLFDMVDLSGASGSRADQEWAFVAGRAVSAACIVQTAGERADEARADVYALITRALGEEKSTVRAAGSAAIMNLLTAPGHQDAADRKAEYRTAAQAALQHFAAPLGQAAADPSTDVRFAAVNAIKSSGKSYPALTQKFMQHFVGPCMKASTNVNIRLKYVADRALIRLLDSGSDAALKTFASGCKDAELVSYVKDYAKRTLCRMPVDSDDESW